MITHILNLGMGVESVACLTRWILDPASRPFTHLSQLVVLIAQTGNEFESTRWLVETFLFPLLRKYNIRVIQVARCGPYRSFGIRILADTRQPKELHIAGVYSLGTHMLVNGTDIRLGSPHTCAENFKGWPLDQSIDRLERQAINRQAATYFKFSRLLSDRLQAAPLLKASSLKGFYRINRDRLLPTAILYAPCQFLIGPHICYSVGEEKRKKKSNEYGCRGHQYIYPVIDHFGWTREDCWNYLKQVFGVSWLKSCCVFCPFIKQVSAYLRYTAEPYGLAQTMYQEANCMHFNPRMHHFGFGTAWMLAHRMRDGQFCRGLKPELKKVGKSEVEFKAQMQAAGQEALDLFERMWYGHERWAIYHVRRIKYKKKPGSKATYDPSMRCIHVKGIGTRQQMQAKLREIEQSQNGQRIRQTITEFTAKMTRKTSAAKLPDFATIPMERVWLRFMGDEYPMTEEWYMVCPAIAKEKVDNPKKFESEWVRLTENSDEIVLVL